MVLAIVATIGAAGLVLYLQYRSIAALRSQTDVILRQISARAAADVAADLRRILDGPVFDTLTAVNHPELRAGRLDLVAQQYGRGLAEYPHVDRFFIWNDSVQARTPGEVMFFGRDGRFSRDPDLGRAIMALARKYRPTQHIYAAAEGLGPAGEHQAFLRLFWTDARRLEYFAVLGFVVDRSRLHQRLFGPEGLARLQPLLARREASATLQLRVSDETGRIVHDTLSVDAVSSGVPFDMQFYPADDIRSRLAAGVEARVWQIQVGVPMLGGAFAGGGSGYGPTVLSIVLILVAFGLTLQANRRSADLAQMQADFVSHVSHQLKTPLSLLSAATETLRLDRIRSPEKFAEYLDTIHGEVARLSGLVQRVLEFSRLQQRSFEFEHVDLGDLARETVAAFAGGFPERRLTVVVPSGGDGVCVHADPAALEQVLANLLDNAVKYSDPGTDITVRVGAENHLAVIEVEDQGVGMTPADQRRVFDRFYRAASASHRPGFGLGLTIVRELVHAQGGRVDLRSVPGAGSTFIVTLPRSTAARTGRRPRPASAEEHVA